MYGEEEVFEYLCMLRDSGEVNMYQSAPYLMEEFNMSNNEAGRWLGDWITSFSKPNCENCG